MSEVVLREVVDGDLEDFFTHQQDPEADRTAAFHRGSSRVGDGNTSIGYAAGVTKHSIADF